MRITIIGTGYVGLVSGACFADFGHEVTCIDSDLSKIEALEAGQMPIYEPGLDVLVADNTAAGRLTFSPNPAAVAESDVVFLAVGTPTRRGDGHADLSYVYAAAEGVARLARGHTVVVTKSTVPVGTGDKVEALISRIAPNADIDVASNPEFLREGAAIRDFKHPDRIVVGAESERAAEVMKELYRPLSLNETPVVITGRRTAELIKYAANAFLATKIAFINEIADLCEVAGANVQEVARGIGLDKRIGPKFLNAGPGYGGSCFPKDTLALTKTAEDLGVAITIVDAVVAANEKRKARMADIVVEAAGGEIAGKVIAVIGLAFKPNTDDMREAPSLEIVPALQAAGATVRAYDPEAMTAAAPLLPGVTFTTDPYKCMEGADIAVILTEWDQFRALDLNAMSALLRERLLVDLRNIYRPAEAARAGLNYRSVGRPVHGRQNAPRPKMLPLVECGRVAKLP